MPTCKHCLHDYTTVCTGDEADACPNFPKGGSKPLIGSHTMLSTFDRCPKQAYHRYVVRDQPYVESESMKWGNQVHSALEVRGGPKKVPLPEAMSRFEKYIAPFDTHHHVRTEAMLGMTLSGKASAFFDNARTGFRGKADLISRQGTHAFMLDWKTGRKWEDPRELEEHATLLKIESPELTSIKGAYVWLKEDELGKVYNLLDKVPETFERIVDTTKTIRQMAQKGTEFPARENKLCGWCSVECKYNPNRRG